MATDDIENHLKALESTLTAKDASFGYETPAHTPGEQRIGSGHKGSDQPDIDPNTEKKESKKGSDGTDFTSDIHHDKTGKQAGDDDEEKETEDEKNAKIAKIARNAAAKIAKLEASNKTLVNQITMMRAQEYIKPMLQARAERGVNAEGLKKFEASMYGKSLEEIQERYEQDKALFSQTQPQQQPLVASTTIVPFNGDNSDVLSASSDFEGKALEEMLK